MAYSMSVTERSAMTFPRSFPVLERFRLILLYFIFGLLLIIPIGVLNCSGAAERAASIPPFALAPEGEFGGAACIEFDRRSFSGDRVNLRRAALRLGWTPLGLFTVWGEGGIGSLQFFDVERILQGAYGPALGGGWSASLPALAWKEITPFISGRMTYLQSKLADDLYQGSSVRSRRSRYEWNEACLMMGGTKEYQYGLLSLGIEFRSLSQDDYRSFRSGASIRKDHFTYSSGFQPGLISALDVPLDGRLTLWILLEATGSLQKITVSVGQWGKP
jgi:hypothetical protein